MNLFLFISLTNNEEKYRHSYYWYKRCFGAVSRKTCHKVRIAVLFSQDFFHLLSKFINHIDVDLYLDIMNG